MISHKFAVIAGDGFGKEVMPVGVRAVQAAARKFNIHLEFTTLDYANCDYYAKHGVMMPPDWREQLSQFEAIYFGAAGWPATVPDLIAPWAALFMFRREFDDYVILRPVRVMPGAPCPLAGKKPGDIDFYVVRENTEGEYSSVGGRMFADTEREVVVQQAAFSRHGTDRILKYAIELAQSRPK